jgi:hypothetical protein
MNEDSITSRLSKMTIVSDSEAARRRAEQDRQQAERAAGSLRAVWNAPKRQSDATAQRIGDWAIKLDAIESKIGTGFLFGVAGTRGNGKTQMAVEAMRTATGRGLSARYETAVALFARIKATFRQSAKESEQDIVAALRKPRLLVIDEIGKRGESDWEQNVLFWLIDSRYGDMTDTLLIGNLEPSGFAQCIGPSLASRLNETGGMILADWPNRR